MNRHHVVPQMLLRRFADDNGRIVMVSREDLSLTVTTGVKNAAAESGFYRIDADDIDPASQAGHDPELVERTLAQVEGLARPLLDALVAGVLPTFEERYRISQFAALQHVRGPGFRADMNRLGTLVARDRLRQTVTSGRAAAFLRERGAPASLKDAEALIDSALAETGPTLVMSRPHAVLEAMRHALDVVQPMLYSRAWHVLRFDAPALLLSDAPVAVWSPPAPDGLPVGVANAAETYLPLSRQAVLIITDQRVDDAPDVVVDGAGRERARRVNSAVASNGHRWVFHHPDDDPLATVELPPPGRWEREIHEVAVEPDGGVRVCGITVKRPRRG